jgi:hypothetical protein
MATRPISVRSFEVLTVAAVVLDWVGGYWASLDAMALPPVGVTVLTSQVAIWLVYLALALGVSRGRSELCRLVVTTVVVLSWIVAVAFGSPLVLNIFATMNPYEAASSVLDLAAIIAIWTRSASAWLRATPASLPEDHEAATS